MFFFFFCCIFFFFNDTATTEIYTLSLHDALPISRFRRTSHVDFTNPDFVKYAESFGARGYRVTGPGQLQGILKEALAQPTLSVIDCPVDYSENLKLTEQLGNLVCPI